MNLQGKAALVTGGGRRLGRAICLELARAGTDIAIHYRSSKKEAQEVAKMVTDLGKRSVLIEADLENDQHWPRIISQAVDGLGRLDILVNNAAIFVPDTVRSDDLFDAAGWDRMIRVNLTAPTALAQLARPHLAANSQGRIINLTDISATRPWPNYQAYCVSKAGLECATKSMARQYAPSVLVNAIALGAVEFSEDCDEGLCASLISKIPLKRIGTAGGLAKMIRAILGHGDFMTGEIIRFDGGRSLL